jgi:hypothetical protein
VVLLFDTISHLTNLRDYISKSWNEYWLVNHLPDIALES